MNLSLRPKLTLVVRILISVALLVLLFLRASGAEWRDVWPDSVGTAAAWLAAAAVVSGVAFGMGTLRWGEVVRTLGLSGDFGPLLSHNLAGQFVSSFLPTTIAGDVLRARRLSLLNPAEDAKSRAYASVVIERLTGWLVLPLLTLFALIVDAVASTSGAGSFSTSTRFAMLTISAVVLITFAGLIWGAEHPRGLGRLAGGNTLRDALGAIHVGLSLYRRRPRSLARLFGAGFAYQSLLVVSVILAAASVGVRPGVVVWFAVVPMVLVIQVLPISIGGLGVREAALLFLLSSQDVTDAQAVLVGLLMYLLALLVSLAGAPALVLGSRSASA